MNLRTLVIILVCNFGFTFRPFCPLYMTLSPLPKTKINTSSVNCVTWNGVKE